MNEEGEEAEVNWIIQLWYTTYHKKTTISFLSLPFQFLLLLLKCIIKYVLLSF